MLYNGIEFDTYFKNYPDANGYFGKYGGAYIPDELKKAMEEINEAYFTICKSRKFIDELRRIRKEFQGRPTPISHLERLSNSLGNVQLYVKREDLNHTGAHKLNHCMGEVLLAKYMGKKKVIAETGAGQHGVAMATAAAYFGMECDIYMGGEARERILLRVRFALLTHFHKELIVIRVHERRFHLLRIAKRFAVLAHRLFGIVMRITGGKRLFYRFLIHTAKHQHFAAFIILRHNGNQSVFIKFQSIDIYIRFLFRCHQLHLRIASFVFIIQHFFLSVNTRRKKIYLFCHFFLYFSQKTRIFLN